MNQSLYFTSIAGALAAALVIGAAEASGTTSRETSPVVATATAKVFASNAAAPFAESPVAAVVTFASAAPVPSALPARATTLVLQPPPSTQLLNCSSIEGGISFTVSESLVNGAYDHSGSVLTYEGITYELNRFETAYDENLGEANVATLFSVALPRTNPALYFTFDIPRSKTSIAINANSATSILMGTKKFSASCHAL